MSLCPRCLALVLVICLGLSGCSPTAETPSSEQNNRHFRAGKEKLAALDYKGAVESFERALEDNPRSALAHFELGVLFEQHESDYAAALYHYNKALKLKPDEYPASNIRQRIPACKQELVKADSLAVINPSALRETEQLREDNAALRKQLELLQAQLGGRPVTGVTANPSSGTRAGTRDNPQTPLAVSVVRTNLPGREVSNGASDSARSAAANPGRRTHSVRTGDTVYSIARQYQIKSDALLAANPGLNPKKMRVGQMLTIPAS